VSSKYPRTNFAHGVSNLKLLTVNEWAGLAFAIALIVCCCQGYNIYQNIYNHHLQKQQSSEVNESQNENGMHEQDNFSDS